MKLLMGAHLFFPSVAAAWVLPDKGGNSPIDLTWQADPCISPGSLALR